MASETMTAALAERDAARDVYKAWKRDAEEAKRQIDAQGKTLLEAWNRTKNRVIAVEEAEKKAGISTG